MNHLNHELAQYIILLFIFTMKFLEWRGKITKQKKVYSRSTISPSFDKRNSFMKHCSKTSLRFSASFINHYSFSCLTGKKRFLF